MAYMRWKDLEAEQRRDLDTKIRFAQGTIAQSLAVCRRRPAVAFSGGKDSLVLLHMVREQRPDVAVVYGNTGVEYPECVKFSRWLAAEWNLNFHEAKPGTTDAAGYRYPAQRTIWEHLVETHQIGTVLKPDGKLKSTAALEAACPPELAARLARDKRNFWPAGAVKSYFWCADQYGWPLLGKAWSLLKARRINIDTFLTFSESQSDKPKLLAYYKILRQVKISQACCDILKKEPAGRVQAGLDVDVLFKGLMAAESRSRAKNFLSRGYLFPGAAKNYLGGKDGIPSGTATPCPPGPTTTSGLTSAATTYLTPASMTWATPTKQGRSTKSNATAAWAVVQTSSFPITTWLCYAGPTPGPGRRSCARVWPLKYRSCNRPGATAANSPFSTSLTPKICSTGGRASLIPWTA